MDYPHKESGLKNKINPYTATTKIVLNAWGKLHIRNPFSFPKYSFSIPQSKVSAKVPEAHTLEPAPNSYRQSKSTALKTTEHSSYNHIDKEISHKISNDPSGKQEVINSRVGSSPLQKGKNTTSKLQPNPKSKLESSTIRSRDETHRSEDNVKNKMCV